MPIYSPTGNGIPIYAPDGLGGWRPVSVPADPPGYSGATSQPWEDHVFSVPARPPKNILGMASSATSGWALGSGSAGEYAATKHRVY